MNLQALLEQRSGQIVFSCEPFPKVTYLNEQMKTMLRAEAGSSFLRHAEENIYFLFPLEERERFRELLSRVDVSEEPISGELTLLCSDGTRLRLYGWIGKQKNPDGTEEYEGICFDITAKHHRRQEQSAQRYIQILSGVYEEIFEYDFHKRSVRCVYGHSYERMGQMAQVSLLLEDANEFWLKNVVHPEDRARVRQTFLQVYRRQGLGGDSRPLQVEFRTCFSDGKQRSYQGVFLQISAEICLFCCRNITEQQLNEDLRRENDSLRSINEQMQELVLQFTDGMLAFEVKNGAVRPLYFSDNICNFFGYSKEEWMALMNGSCPIPEFVARSGIAYGDFLNLLQTRQAEFDYYDGKSAAMRRMRAICTANEKDNADNCYVLLYDVTQKSEEKAQSPVYIRTFGYFDVFVKGQPIAFRNEKAKELFALLVDRRGGYVTSSEAISFLWEDEPVNPVTLARYRKVALRLKNLLEEYGIASVVEAVDGKRRIVPQNVQCDLFDYLSGEERHRQLFKGSYLLNYSWAETTLSELVGDGI